MKWMINFFSYMDRFHTERQTLPPIKGYDMGKKYSGIIYATVYLKSASTLF